MLGSNSLKLLLTLCLFNISHLAPVDPKKKTENVDEKIKDLGLGYQRYLQQVASLLESDAEFADRLKRASPEKLKTGEIADELAFVQHHIRSALDEVKRRELDRLREYARKQMESNDIGVKSFPIPKHLDLRNSHTFEAEDLRKLISAAYNDLEAIDEKRKEEFKQYELEKEHAYREKLRHANETEQQELKKKHEEMIKKHKDHPAVHHPGSKPQLEEVWEEQDHLPKEEFDPRVFFSLHDLNADNFLDEQEVEAILTAEIKKIYDENNEEDDPVERMEEFARMAEHIFNETDKNKDRLISREEFLDMTGRKDFDNDYGWKGVEDEIPFTDEELEEYERELREKLEVHEPKEEKAPVPP